MMSEAGFELSAAKVTVRACGLARPLRSLSIAVFSWSAVVPGVRNTVRASFSSAQRTLAALCRAQAIWKTPNRKAISTGETSANSRAVAPPSSARHRRRRRRLLADAQDIALRQAARLHEAGEGPARRQGDVDRRRVRARAQGRAGDGQSAAGAAARHADRVPWGRMRP